VEPRPRKVAFVATGGAAKGLAHLGVLLAAEELGLTFDLWVGSSAGAIPAAFCAQGFPADRLVDWFRPPWRRRFSGPAFSPLRFVGLPRGWSSLGYLASGLLSIEPFERYLRKALPANDFREVGRDLYVVATDLDSCERVVFGRGHVEDVPISRAVAASCCIPGLFRPYRIGDRYYIDGETKRTFSADVAIARGADLVVISNVYNPHLPQQGRSLAHQGARAVIGQAMNLVLHEKTVRGLDLYRRAHPGVELVVIEPDVGHLSFLNHFHARAFIQRGYREARARLLDAQRRGLLDRPARAAQA
jgi:NTE family protein